mmetsp:Transcript_34577/g.79032  ORF Transcript_34577/g.79032 Transcript_34577/m.79032 type:complete len:447 (+) Transcript_34577:73-1413(+)
MALSGFVGLTWVPAHGVPLTAQHQARSTQLSDCRRPLKAHEQVSNGIAAARGAAAVAAFGALAARLARRQKQHRRWQRPGASVLVRRAANEASDEEAWARFRAWSTERGGKLDNVRLSRFDMGSGELVRGLMATRDIAEGESIIELPMTAVLEVIDPNSRNQDPAVVAHGLLKLLEGTEEENAPYFDMFPAVGSADMATMPDFFNDDEISMLQFPSVEEKTRLRKRLCSQKARELDVAEERLRWAVCTVAQRAFTIHSPVDGVLRLLLPGIDLFNHDADSFHRLRVLWTLDVFDGLFKVVAGSNITAGEEIRICYGGSPHRPDGCGGDCAGDIAWTNDQYVQRYGFVDRSLGTTMVDGKWLVTEDAATVRDALEKTSIAEDEALLDSSDLSEAARTAVGFRVHLKRALKAQREAEVADEAAAKKADDEASETVEKKGAESAVSVSA